MTYLIIRLATIGNVAMAVPVVASVSKRYPNDRFVFVSKKDLGAMFFGMPNVEFREVDNHLGWKGVFAIWRQWREDIDAVIDLQNVLRTRVFGFLMRWSGKRVTRVRYGRIHKHLITFWGIGKQQLPTEFEQSMEMHNYDSSCGEYKVTNFKGGLKYNESDYTFSKSKNPGVEVIDMR